MFTSLLAQMEALNISGWIGYPTIPVPSDLLDKSKAHACSQFQLLEGILKKQEYILGLMRTTYAGQTAKETAAKVARTHRLVIELQGKFLNYQQLIHTVESQSTSLQGKLGISKDHIVEMCEQSQSICDSFNVLIAAFSDMESPNQE